MPLGCGAAPSVVGQAWSAGVPRSELLSIDPAKFDGRRKWGFVNNGSVWQQWSLIYTLGGTVLFLETCLPFMEEAVKA